MYSASKTIEFQIGLKKSYSQFEYWRSMVRLIIIGSTLGLLITTLFPSFLPAQVVNYTVTYTYDGTYPNGIGKLASVNDSSGSSQFFYDTMGNLVRTDKVVNNNGTYTTKTSYDLEGRVASITYPDNDVVNYHYNGPLLDRVYQNATTTYAQYSGFNPMGQPSTVTYLNGVSTNYTYCNSGNSTCPTYLVATANTSSSSGTVYQNLAYTYTSKGNISVMTDMVNGSQNFTYDEQDRLLSANGPYGATNYAYDPIGNMTCNSALSGCASSTPNYSYGNPAHVHAVTNGAGTLYGYDNNGNMTGRGSNRLTYDAENRLIYVTSSTGTSTMIYDGDGGRVEKITPAGTTIYIGKLYECTGTNCIKYIFSGGSRIATKTVTGNSIYYYHTDHLGSSSVMTDASGKNAETMKYAPYGLGYYDSYINGNGAIYTPYKYTGQYFDSDTSLYFYNARYYDPALGRFISADSVIGRPMDPQSFNRYSYVRNNPIIYSDPTGHSWVSDFIDRQSEWLHDNGSKIGNVVAATAITAVICVATSGGGCVAAAIAAAGSTTYLETKEGKRDVAWVANRVFDNFFGIKDESLDYSLAYIGLDAGLTMGITSGYDYFSSGSATGSGTTESTPENSLEVSNVPQPEEVRVAGGNYITGEDAWEPKGIGGNGYPTGGDNLRALPGGGDIDIGEITGYTRHGLNQAISREGVGVNPKAILDAVRSPLEIIKKGQGITEYVGENAIVRLNEAGKVVTVIPKGSGAFRIPTGQP